MAQNSKDFKAKTGIELESLGSAGSPGYSFSADPDTGLYSSGANNVDIAAGGTQILNATSTTVTFRGAGVANSLKLTEDGVTGGLGLILAVNSGITTADKTLTFNVNNANRTFAMSGNLTVSADATVSGSNTGDQNVFTTIAVGADSGYTWGSSNVVSDALSDTLTLVPEVAVVLNTDAALDAIKIGVRAATTGQTGITQLTDSVSSTSTTTAATANSVKTAYDAAVLKAGSTSIGKQVFATPSTSIASINLPNGAADPSVPVSGDLWVNTSAIKYYTGSATKTIPFSDGTIQVATTITTSNDTSDTTSYPIFVNNASASNQGAKYNANLGFDALNNVLSVAGGAFLSSGGALGTTQGNSLTPLKVEATTSNADKLHVFLERTANGTDATTARWKLKRVVDTTDAGYIAFGNPATNTIIFGKDTSPYATFYSGGHFLINTQTDDTVNFLQVAGGISATGGTNTAPGYTFSGDLDTGMYSNAANTLLFATNATERARFHSTGQMSIGSATQSGQLYVQGTNGIRVSDAGTVVTEITGNSGGYGVVGTSSNHPLYFRANSVDYMRLLTSGTLLVGAGLGASASVYAGSLEIFNDATDGTEGLVINTYKPSIVFLDRTGAVGAYRIAADAGSLMIDFDSAEDGTFESTRATMNNAGDLALSSTTASSSTITGALKVAGGTGIAGALYVGGVFRNTDSTASSSTSTGASVITGGLGVGGKIYAGGDINATSATASSSTTTGALVVTGGVGISGKIYAGGDVNFSSTTASTSTITGALTVGGGLGVAGAIYSDTLNTTNAVTVGGDLNANNGYLKTTQTTGYLFNANATTLHIGEAATTISVGASTAVTTFNGTGGIVPPSGADGTRPGTPATGIIRWSTTNNGHETYTGSEWRPIGGSATTVSTTPPTSPAPKTGDLWWDDTNGELFIYYDDGVDQQWVSIIATGAYENYLPETGGTMQGDIDLGNNDILGIKTAGFYAEYNNGNSGTAKTVTLTNGQKQKVTLDNNTTITISATGAPVGHYQLRVIQDATGGRTLAWSGLSASRWLNSSTAPTINSAANGETIVNIFNDGTNLTQSMAKVGSA